MKILVAHNYYQYAGGEDVVFAAERDLLRDNGHEVIEFTANNDAVDSMNKAVLAYNTVWSHGTNKALKALIEKEKPAVAHFHNTFMMMSPSVYYVCQRMNVPVVQTLHNYRLFCLNATFYRDNQICMDCATQFVPMSGIRHRCYKDSTAVSGVAAANLVLHRLGRTWQKQVDAFIPLTNFSRDRFIEFGLPEDKLFTKSNFLKDDLPVGDAGGDYAIFIGRLTAEKGVRTLIRAWQQLPDIPLKIVGEGPLMAELETFITEHGMSHVTLMGKRPREETMALLREARVMLFPSEWYETFGMTVIEAFASGVPVIASDLGSIKSLVNHGENGLRFEPGNADALAQTVTGYWNDEAQIAGMSTNARQSYEQNYTAKRNYERLIDIYEHVVNHKEVATHV